MGLEEMEAYAQQALKIASLERGLEEAEVRSLSIKEEAEAEAKSLVSKEEVKSWFSTISDEYVFIANESKKEVLIALGEKNG